MSVFVIELVCTKKKKKKKENLKNRLKLINNYLILKIDNDM